MEAELSVKLSEEEWALAATKLLQIYYLQFYAMGDELARQGHGSSGCNPKKAHLEGQFCTHLQGG